MKKLIIVFLIICFISPVCFAGSLKVEIEYKEEYKQKFLDAVCWLFQEQWKECEQAQPSYTDEQLFNETIELLILDVQVRYTDYFERRAIQNERIADPYD